MKGKLTFLLIQSHTGRRRRFSVSRNFITCMILLFAVLAGSGIWGAVKYADNLELKKKCTALEIERGKYEAVSRRIQNIEKDEAAVRKLLGLQVSGGELYRSGSDESSDIDEND